MNALTGHTRTYNTSVDQALFTSSPLFARIRPADIDALVRSAQRRKFRAWEVLFRRGDEGDGVYAVISGQVCVFADTADGDETVIAVRGPGEVVGEMSLLDDMPRSASARAQSDVEAAWVSREQFEAWIAAHPAAAREMLTALAQRLREATDQIAEVSLLGIEARLARRLWLEFSRQAKGEPQAGARLQLSQGQIASLLGVTRESVNKHLARLRASGAVTTSATGIVLTDPAALRTAADAL